MFRKYNQISLENSNVTLNINFTEKNKSKLTVHSNSMGTTCLIKENIFDTDVLKILRFMKKHEYSRISLSHFLYRLTKICNHLDFSETEILSCVVGMEYGNDNIYEYYNFSYDKKFKNVEFELKI